MADDEGPTDEGATDEGATNEAPTDEGATNEGPIDAPGTLPASVEELIPVMEPEPAIEPLPVMDPAAAEASHENVAFRMLHSLTSRTSPTEAPGTRGPARGPDAPANPPPWPDRRRIPGLISVLTYISR